MKLPPASQKVSRSLKLLSLVISPIPNLVHALSPILIPPSWKGETCTPARLDRVRRCPSLVAGGFDGTKEAMMISVGMDEQEEIGVDF